MNDEKRFEFWLRISASMLVCLQLAVFCFPVAFAAEPLQKVAIQLRWDHQFQFAGYYAAKWQGYYAEAGFDVDIRSAITPDGRILSAVDEVAKGNADFGVGAADILLANDNGSRLVVVASIFQQSAAEFYARPASMLVVPADFLRLKVARQVGDLIDVELQAMLLLEGIDPKQIIPYPHQPGIKHFVDDQVEVVPGYRLSIPFDFAQQGVRVSSLRPVNYGIDFYGDSLFTHQKMLKTDYQTVERFRRATVRGWEYALEHPEEIIQRIVADLPRKSAVVGGNLLEFNRFQSKGVKELTQHPFIEMGNTNPQRWRRMSELMLRVGVIKNPVNIDELIFELERFELQKQKEKQESLKTVLWILGGLIVLSGIILLTYLRKKLKEKKESENKLRSYIDAAPNGLFIVDHRGRYLEVNPAACEITGYSEEALLQMRVTDLLPQQSLAAALAHFQKVMNTGAANGEFLFRTKSGAMRYWMVNAVKLSPTRAMGFVQDITERKRLEISNRRNAEIQSVLREIAEAMAQSPSLDKFFATVYRSVQNILLTKDFYISVHDRDKNQIVLLYYCAGISNSIESSRPMGRGLTEYLMRQKCALYLTTEDLAELVDQGEVSANLVLPANWLGAPLIDSRGGAFGAMIADWETDAQEKYAGDHTERWGIDPESFHEQNRKLWATIAAQVSTAIERIESKETLLESEAKYRAVMEQAPDALLLCDPDTGEIVECNRRFTNLLGYELAQFEKLSIFDLIDDKEENIRKLIDTLKENGFCDTKRRVFRHATGVQIHAERTASFIRFMGRSFVLMTVRDLSVEVRREQEIRRDAQMATRVQNALLPVIEPSEYLEISTIYQPYSYVGGDLYFLDWRFGGTLLRGFLIDATGHGLGTALHTASLHVLIREINEKDLPLSDAMRWINRRAIEYFDEGIFASAIGFEFDLQTRQLRWVCAGIHKLWLTTKSTQGLLEYPGMSLGIMDEETFDTHEMSIDVGDSFYFMTDGLTDPLDKAVEVPINSYSAMVKLLEGLSEKKDRLDDATAVCIQVNALPNSMIRNDGWPKILHFSGYGDYRRFKGEIGKVLEAVTGEPHSIQEVAVHEALVNAMECRDGVPRQHRARVRFNKVGNRLIVRVKTSRIGFAGNAVLRRLRSHPEEMFSFGEDAGMGRGIPIMLSTSHKMTYNSEGTELLLAWKL